MTLLPLWKACQCSFHNLTISSVYVSSTPSPLYYSRAALSSPALNESLVPWSQQTSKPYLGMMCCEPCRKKGGKKGNLEDRRDGTPAEASWSQWNGDCQGREGNRWKRLRKPDYAMEWYHSWIGLFKARILALLK